MKLNSSTSVENLNISPTIANAMLVAGWVSSKESLPQMKNKNEYILWSDWYLGCLQNDNKKVIVTVFNLKTHLKPKKHPYTDEIMGNDYVYVQTQLGVHRELADLLFWMPIPEPPSACH